MNCEVCEDAEAELQALVPVGKKIQEVELCEECAVKEDLVIEETVDKEDLDE
jgi:protein-arginine kinase activator protein McsA